jgi:hypothetical protein
MLSNEPDILPLPVSVAGDEPALTFRRIHSHHINQQQRQGLAADATTSRV